MGPTLKDIPNISWKYVKEEKSEDMIHVLQFPYNGEPPRVCTTVWIRSTLIITDPIGPFG